MTFPDVLVLGAGMVGTATALQLARRGHAVCLVDRREPGRETSYGNAGILQAEAVEPHAFPREWAAVWRVATEQGLDARWHLDALPAIAGPLLRYWRASAPDRYPRIVASWRALIAHVLAEHGALIEESGAQALVRRDGYLQAYRTPQVLELAAARAERLAREHGVAHVMLDAEALSRAEPGLRTRLAGAVHWPQPWRATDPGALVERYAQAFVARGGTFSRGDASTLQADGAGWQVRTGDGPVSARHAVVALGPWSAPLVRRLGYRLPLFVKRGYHRHFTGGPGLARPLLDAERGYVLAPMDRGLRLTTGAEFARLDARPTPVQMAGCTAAARELLDLPDPVEAEPWLGARPCIADMTPVMGAAPRHPGLWFNFAHAHQGFSLGPVAGRLLAELIAGDRPFVDPAPYAASRFD